MEPKQSFIVIAFPVGLGDSATKAQRLRHTAQVAGPLIDALTRACGEMPHLLHPDTTAICLLVHGEFTRVAEAADESTASETRVFIARVDTPSECIGLSAAETWLRRSGVA